MFISGYPLVSLIALVSNYTEMRIIAWKLCNLSLRPDPHSLEDIGTWY